MFLSKTLYLLLSTGSTQEDLPQHDRKIVDKGSIQQTKNIYIVFSSMFFPCTISGCEGSAIPGYGSE